MSKIKYFGRDQLLQLGQDALISHRKRINFNLHESSADPIQRMVNVLEPGTYMCPHIHKDSSKREMFVLLHGRLLLCLFDNSGVIAEHFILDKTEGMYLVEIPVTMWHTLIPLAVHTTVFEIKDGPYDEGSDKIFAQWAPPEGSDDGQAYNKKILDKLGIVFPEFM